MILNVSDAGQRKVEVSSARSLNPGLPICQVRHGVHGLHSLGWDREVREAVGSKGSRCRAEIKARTCQVLLRGTSS